MSQKTIARLERLQQDIGCSGSWRAVCAETCKHCSEGERLVSLSTQDLASYPTLFVRKTLIGHLPKARPLAMRQQCRQRREMSCAWHANRPDCSGEIW
jgi:hypothetical protein